MLIVIFYLQINLFLYLFIYGYIYYFSVCNIFCIFYMLENSLYIQTASASTIIYYLIHLVHLDKMVILKLIFIQCITNSLSNYLLRCIRSIFTAIKTALTGFSHLSIVARFLGSKVKKVVNNLVLQGLK